MTAALSQTAFSHELANCLLTFGNSIFAILDKAIFIEHGFLLSLAQLLKQTIEYMDLSSAILLSAKAAGKMRGRTYHPCSRRCCRIAWDGGFH